MPARCRRLRFPLCVLGIVLASFGGCRSAVVPTTQAAEQADLDALLQLMRQRLELMHDVARWKWNAGRSVADPQRERETLDAVVERGQAKGVDPQLLRSFFSAQIEAARHIQQADFDRWKAQQQGPFAENTSLDELRKKIDAMNAQLIDSLATVSSKLDAPVLQQVLPQRALAILTGEDLADVRVIAVAPLRR